MKNLPKNSGFKAPDSYFDKLSEKIYSSVVDKNAIPKNEGFTVPDNYFDTVHTRVQKRIQTLEPKVIHLETYRKKYYFAAAAAAAIILFTTILWNNNATTLTFQDLASTDIENYFNDVDLDLSTYDLAQMLPIDEFEITDVIDVTINEEQIMNYLESNNGIDIQELYLDNYE
ncbi:hypothetical protein MWU65_07115 [Cellulophaga sp. F20128]|uniref:hypothetical protein n=1 Tax=Cellulophaga sp. F20128 TaxID=2926413 RepID=UPI001FF5548E|nr:hypothetical protein [Cellulophaga sp. F20128]MCK0156944.1 hypothetical protein [Cellulophaga sp. F20128]